MQISRRRALRVLCYTCRLVGLGRGRSMRICQARTRARDRAWKLRSTRQTWRLEGKGAPHLVARCYKGSQRLPQVFDMLVDYHPQAEEVVAEPLGDRSTSSNPSRISRPKRPRQRPSCVLFVACLLAIFLGGHGLAQASWARTPGLCGQLQLW